MASVTKTAGALVSNGIDASGYDYGAINGSAWFNAPGSDYDLTVSRVTADDGTTVGSSDDKEYSDVLCFSSLGLGLPTGAIVTNISVTANAWVNAGAVDAWFRLSKNAPDPTGTLGTDITASGLGTDTDGSVTYSGTPADWGVAAWTVAELNATTFGVLYRSRATGAVHTLDYLEITVSYSGGSRVIMVGI